MTGYTKELTESLTLSEDYSNRPVLDDLNYVSSLITAGWTRANTANRTPTIGPVQDHKRVDAASVDFVLMYLQDRIEEPNGLGYPSVRWTLPVSIDIRTSVSRQHAVRMVREVRRIIWANRKAGTNYTNIIYRREKDLSDKLRNLWRYVVDVDLNKAKEAVVT